MMTSVNPLEVRGPNGIRTAITDYLRMVLPPHVEACREAWGLTEEQLPLPVDDRSDPKKDAYFDREPPAIDRWPMLAVVSGRLTGRAADHDLDAGETIYRSVCPVRAYVWVKAEGPDETLRMRDDLATAVRIAVLSQQSLGTAQGRLTLVPSTVLTDFSDIVAVKGERFVAGAFVGFDVIVLETLTERLALPGRGERDTVAGVSADVGLLTNPPATEEGP